MTNYDDLVAMLDMEAKPWKPQPGDRLVGTIVNVRERLGYKNIPYLVYTIRTAEGELWDFHAFHTIAKQDMAAYTWGDDVAIKYVGRESNKDGNDLEKYIIRGRKNGADTSDKVIERVDEAAPAGPNKFDIPDGEQPF